MKAVRTVPIKRRARRPKVKTGCWTCKARHVKCDEAFPACSRCTKTGRKCEGYEVRLKENEACIPVKHDGFLDPITRLPFGFPCDDEQERRAFQYFFTKTSPEIAGFLPSDFWSKLILQASHTDPAILHAVIALGSAHENYGGEAPGHLRNAEPGKKPFALEQSNKAIRHLQPHFSLREPRSRETVLLTCVLFICLETFQGDHQAALGHLDSGLKLVKDWLHEDDQHEPCPSTRTISRPTRKFLEEEIVPLFTRLDVQATTYISSRSLQEVHPNLSLETPVIPIRFTSLSDANNHLADVVHWMLYYNNKAHNMMYWMVNNPLAQVGFCPPPLAPGDVIPEIPPIMMNRIQKIETLHGNILQQWLDALNLYMKEHPNQDPKDLRGAVMLKIMFTNTTILKAASFYNHDLEYDKQITNFQRVIKLVESLMGFHTKAKDKGTPMYSFEMNILPPLHYCSTRCRDPKLRRRALSLLEESPRREGMWDSAMLAAIAKYIIEEEEAGLGEVTAAEQVPASSRICILDKEPMLEERKCIIKYCKGVRNPYAKLDILEALISW